MLNQFVLVGRIVSDLKLNETENGRKELVMKLAISRSYKNSDGLYDTDFIDCVIWNGIAENTVEYCKKGDVVGVKGTLMNKDNNLIAIAEKVTFLSSKKVED